jgi:hypothetical protein
MTVSLDFQIIAPADPPPPLAFVRISYPIGLDIGLSELGIDECRPNALEAAGLQACPPDSLIGEGEIATEIQLGSQAVHERARIVLVRAPERDGHLAMLLYAEGKQPVIARLIFPVVLLPAEPPFGGILQVTVPPLTGLPVSAIVIRHLHLVLGPPNLTYYEHLDGRTIAYHPKGLVLPKRCPSGGYPFSASFAFRDDSSASARTAVPCTRRGGPTSVRTHHPRAP